MTTTDTIARLTAMLATARDGLSAHHANMTGPCTVCASTHECERRTCQPAICSECSGVRDDDGWIYVDLCALHAAAADMRDALAQLLHLHEQGGVEHYYQPWEQARAALDKARSTTPTT